MTQIDYFELFDLPRRFSIDQDALEQKWKSISSKVHPDRFASASAVEKRVAVEWSAHANEAFRVLKEPLKRAEYLCQLAGIDTSERHPGAMDIDFLETQMSWREALAEADQSHHVIDLNALQASVQAASSRYEMQVGELINHENWQKASDLIREWMFVQKFAQEVTRAVRSARDANRQISDVLPFSDSPLS